MAALASRSAAAHPVALRAVPLRPARATAGLRQQPARLVRPAPVALPPLAPRPGAPTARAPVACEAFGLGTIGAICGKVLGWLGIKGGAGAVKAAAASAAATAGSAGKAALMAGVMMGMLKYFWLAIVGVLAVGVAAGIVLSYLGVPQVAVQQVTTLLGKPALKLYTNPASRGQIVNWYLSELGVEADQVNMDMKEKREHKSPEFLKVNPFGKLPALSDGDFNLFESGALLLYLADKYPLKSGIITPQQRAAASQWVLFANSTLANSVFVEQFREKAFPDVFSSLDRILSEREWLENGKFSVSDVAVGSYLLYIPAFFPDLDLSPYPHVQAYMKRLSERDACASTVLSRAQAKRTEELSKTATAQAA